MGFTRKNIHENTIFNTRFTNSTALCILKENFQKPTRLLFHFFCFHFLSRWINSNKFKFELVHLHKNIIYFIFFQVFSGEKALSNWAFK